MQQVRQAIEMQAGLDELKNSPRLVRFQKTWRPCAREQKKRLGLEQQVGCAYFWVNAFRQVCSPMLRLNSGYRYLGAMEGMDR
jgi:hypothetical protein